jgi:Ser/Thr protein kinase RdoA (MazF antagonist)
MEPRIKALFNESMLEVAKTLYDMDLNSLKLLGGFESFVYEYTKNQQSYILKVTHSSHRTKDQIDAEFDFVNHLYVHGGRVSKPILNRHGNYTHRIPLDDGYFTLSSTEKAVGNRPTDILNHLELIDQYGQTIGGFHQITMGYQPSFNIDKRFTWYDDPLIIECKKYLDESDMFVYDAMVSVITQIKQIPITPANYGLIHTDIHRSNFLVDDNNQLTVFDFDDAAYFYFMSDIAIAVFYTVFFHPNRLVVSKDFIIRLMKGYLKKHTITQSDFKTLDLFFRLRMIILYVALKRSTKKTDPFTEKYNAIYLDLIRNNQPFLDLDFNKLYDEIIQK